jgi:hypothetical protein
MPQRDHIPYYKTKMTTYWFVYHNLQNFGDTVTCIILKLKTNLLLFFSSSTVFQYEMFMSLTICKLKQKLFLGQMPEKKKQTYLYLSLKL